MKLDGDEINPDQSMKITQLCSKQHHESADAADETAMPPAAYASDRVFAPNVPSWHPMPSAYESNPAANESIGNTL